MIDYEYLPVIWIGVMFTIAALPFIIESWYDLYKKVKRGNDK